MVNDTDRKLKDLLGRLAYFYTGTKHLSARRVKAKIGVFSQAESDDGLLELAVVTAKNPWDWAGTLGRVAQGKVEKSPFVKIAQGKEFDFMFNRRFPYEIDGSARTAVKKGAHQSSSTNYLPTFNRPSSISLDPPD